jgi:hypothetical protein
VLDVITGVWLGGVISGWEMKNQIQVSVAWICCPVKKSVFVVGLLYYQRIRPLNPTTSLKITRL